ncbi:MAG: Asp-tRNA(Asn)/Glu-tRNA(Gln) amidotransferase subunit GatA [Puniceicoccales bacterium]|jgi:aspartyl-tRNA(Asn)/glutamyl-tRNA(Gln) amidotransferase subunit A|nr:Asp-tRNA(Asn)/Glu-tRNA(Gln) amidotransferase subunit GatA [Puniceicoccales bacterium]
MGLGTGQGLHYETAERLSAALASRTICSVELVESLLGRARTIDGKLRAFIALDGADALRQAVESDRRRERGAALGPLDGVAVSIKDNMSVRRWPMSCGSRMLDGYVSPYDCHVVERLRAAGAIIFGRTNMDEFAMGSSTENSAFFGTANPWDLGRVPGGSSGGSACAVAAGLAPLALGTDTGGSVRQPAAFCAAVGLKPTYGRVSRYGVTAFASSLDQVGPMGRSVWDVAALLGAIAGLDRRDSTSSPLAVPDYTVALGRERRWKIAVPREVFSDGLDGDVRDGLRRAVDFFAGAGCEILDVSMPAMDISIGAYYITATAEAFSNLSRFDGIRYGHRSKVAGTVGEVYAKSRGEGFGAEVKRRIMLGAFVLSGGYHEAYYGRAQRARVHISNGFGEIFRNCDFIATPTAPTVPFPVGAKTQDPLAMYLSDIYTVSVNLVGLPAISVCCGFSPQGLPMGLQLIAKPFHEEELLAAAAFFERNHDFCRRHPKIDQ